nr:IS200/IS605 family transposase [Thermovibrio guaymasensis]
MKSNIRRGRTCVYNCNYHIVFSTKYRQKVLTPEVEDFLKRVMVESGIEKGFEVAMVEVGEQDHVYILVSAHPKIAPSYIVKMVKGISTRKLFLKFPELKKKLWKGHLWNPSYYIETIGSNSEDVIRKYLENQKRK